MKFLESKWFPIILGVAIVFVIIKDIDFGSRSSSTSFTSSTSSTSSNEWKAPDIDTVPDNEYGRLVRYGQDLIVNTAKYLGPRGTVAAISNGMNCQNCHADAGLRPFGNSFAAVASTYPKFRDRSGKMETVEFRVNECMERSMNGSKLDSNSREMLAMISYLLWVGKNVPKGTKPEGAGIEELKFMDRAADVAKGKAIYIAKCQLCHGPDGEGQLQFDSSGYLYPPLWGPNSYNVSAGLFRLSRFAGYVKNNMPFGSTHENPQLTNEEAWDVAAFVNSQPRPNKKFAYDWPDIKTKPVDHPFGPYADGYTEKDHKYGPFGPIKLAREKVLANAKKEGSGLKSPKP